MYATTISTRSPVSALIGVETIRHVPRVRNPSGSTVIL